MLYRKEVQMSEPRYSGDAWVRIWQGEDETREEMMDRLSEALAELESQHGIKVDVNMNDEPD